MKKDTGKEEESGGIMDLLAWEKREMEELIEREIWRPKGRRRRRRRRRPKVREVGVLREGKRAGEVKKVTGKETLQGKYLPLRQK
jgi:hypothetical protein